MISTARDSSIRTERMRGRGRRRKEGEEEEEEAGRGGGICNGEQPDSAGKAATTTQCSSAPKREEP